MATELFRSYSLEKSKNSNNDVVTSGSLTLWKDTPVSPFDVGDTFQPVNSSPVLTVEKVSIKDNVVGLFNGKPVRQWEVTVEGSDETSASSTTHVKYNFNISAGEKSGTMEVTNTGDTPTITLDIGDTFSVPGIGEVFCSNVKGSDDYDDKGVRHWTVIYEGANKAVVQDRNVKYTLSIENNSDGVAVYTGTKEITCTGAAPTISTTVGRTFSVPYVGSLTCTRVQSSNDGDTWTVIIEGSRGGSSSDDPDDPETPSMPENETVINYELNGITVRTVAGEFLALRRSETPITKKSVTVYTNTVTAVASPGSTYEGGTVLSENIVKETIKSNGVVTGSYYKHTLEVEL